MTETLLWEAWEDYDAVTGCKTIYVLGEAEIEGEKYIPVLCKKNLPGLPGTNLLLELVASSSPVQNSVEELMYSEQICDEKHYDTISIFLGNRIIAEITELEHLETV